jgi:hypothetical protein
MYLYKNNDAYAFVSNKLEYYTYGFHVKQRMHYPHKAISTHYHGEN